MEALMLDWFEFLLLSAIAALALARALGLG
jgi:hypothetical protein